MKPDYLLNGLGSLLLGSCALLPSPEKNPYANLSKVVYSVQEERQRWDLTDYTMDGTLEEIGRFSRKKEEKFVKRSGMWSKGIKILQQRKSTQRDFKIAFFDEEGKRTRTFYDKKGDGTLDAYSCFDYYENWITLRKEKIPGKYLQEFETITRRVNSLFLID